jgi:ornithine cyclodeaminase
MLILDRAQIAELLPKLELMSSLEQGFVDYSQGNCIVPPVGELLLEHGEIHIKYGCVRNERFYIIKIASGFYQNPELGLPSSNGLMQLFEQKTGQLAAILLDEGLLTDIRTAVAGAICAKHLAPKGVRKIGIVGTGTQARLQAQYVGALLDCRDVVVWGRSNHKVLAYQQQMNVLGFNVVIADTVEQLCSDTRLIITTTPSQEPIVNTEWVQAGTHITAVGSDTPQKQEIDAQLLARADKVVGDSIAQCMHRGEISKALISGYIVKEDILELGEMIRTENGRSDERQITVADLTGVAVQDIKIAENIFLAASA